MRPGTSAAPSRLAATRPVLALLAGALVLATGIAGCGKGDTHTGAGQDVTPAATHGKARPRPPQAIATGSTTRIGGANATEDAAAVAETVYPGLTPATRPKAVVLVGEHDWPGALAASPLTGGRLRAPILYDEGGSVPTATSAALAALEPVGAQMLGGAQVITVGKVAAPSGYKTLAVEGATPYKLAAKLAALVARLDGGRVGQAIVADAGDRQALAMPVAGLAAESGAPVLLVQAGAVPAVTTTELESLRDPSIYAVGPEASIGAAALDALQKTGETRRIGGGGAVQNAIAVAAYTDGTFGWGVQEPGHGIVFARASSPFDAPAAALLSASADYGPLLLLPSSGPVPLPVQRYLRDIQPGYTSAPESLPVRGVYNRGWLIGDEDAISLDTQAELDALLRSVPRKSAYPAPKISP